MKDPEIRARELEGSGVPTPYKVNFAALVDSPRNLEQHLHRHFKMFHHGKEWFKAEPDKLILELKNVINHLILYSDEFFKNTNKTESDQPPSIPRQSLFCAICGVEHSSGDQHKCDKTSWPQVTCKGCLLKGIKTFLRVPPNRSMLVKCPKCKVKFKANTNKD